MLSFFLAGLAIFALRVVDISIATVRLKMVVSGRKLWAWVLGFIQATIFISVIRTVLQDIGEWNRVIGYAAGFATGLIVGMTIESRMALGYTRLRIISPRLGSGIAEKLRESGYGTTEIPAHGKDGTVDLIDCFVPRRQTGQIVRIIDTVDENAFITAESVRTVQHGFWHNQKRVNTDHN